MALSASTKRNVLISFLLKQFTYYNYFYSLCIIDRSRSMVAQHLQRDALLGHRHNGLFVHVRIVDAHAAENSKCLHKVLVVAREFLKNT